MSGYKTSKNIEKKDNSQYTSKKSSISKSDVQHTDLSLENEVMRPSDIIQGNCFSITFLYILKLC